MDRHELDHELIWLFTTLALGLIGAAWLHFNLPLPECHFRHALGIPCPTCGATRATLALLRGDLMGALAVNPLYVAGIGLIAIYDIYGATVLLGRLPRLRINPGKFGTLFRWGVIGVILANWVWLIHRGI